MVWFYCNKNDFIGAECINSKTNKHVVRLSPNNKFNINNKNDENNIRFISKYVNNLPNVKELKNILLSLQKEYDNCNEVNSFIINDKQVWLDKSTRLGIFNLLNIEKNIGKHNTTLWFGDLFVNVNINKAIDILNSIELYAKACYNNTQIHIKEINNLETIEDLLAFDITAGYPDKLTFNSD